MKAFNRPSIVRHGHRFVLAGALLMSLVPLAAAETPQISGPALEKRLQTYDPKAVAAARHYFERPLMIAALTAMIDNIDKAMIGQIAKQNPSLRPDQMTKIQAAVGDAMKERLPLLIEINMVAALDTFTTSELKALDTFYSSPDGTAILTKMPKMSAQLPAMLQGFMPDYMAAVRAKLKASDAELKL